MQTFGVLTSRTPHQQLVKSPVVSIAERLEIEIAHNDVPVTLYYKHGNYPWRCLLINNAFSADAVPRGSDVYLMCSASASERVEYNIRY